MVVTVMMFPLEVVTNVDFVCEGLGDEFGGGVEGGGVEGEEEEEDEEEEEEGVVEGEVVSDVLECVSEVGGGDVELSPEVMDGGELVGELVLQEYDQTSIFRGCCHTGGETLTVGEASTCCLDCGKRGEVFVGDLWRWVHSLDISGSQAG